MSVLKNIFFPVATVIVITGLLVSCGNKEKSYFTETAVVEKGTIINTVTATGTLQALQTVDVGTQVSGVISKIYVDFNSQVKKGDVIAELDKTPLLVALRNAEAGLEDAQAEHRLYTSKFERSKALFEKEMLSQSEFDDAQYMWSKTGAALKIAESNYEKAKINLNYATIYSPIDGVVLSREVDEGQTVAANFSAPVLFRIANDLTRMQVEANIDEADIGKVKQNQSVTFTVDAFTDVQFVGVISEIRLQSVITSNVVTYTVIVEAANPDKKLMPGMTANISITTEELQNVLVIPHNAIQLELDSEIVASYNKSVKENQPTVKYEIKRRQKEAQVKTVWVKHDNVFEAQKIETGSADDLYIEVKSGLIVNDIVLMDLKTLTESTGASEQKKSPFMPSPPQKKDRKMYR